MPIGFLKSVTFLSQPFYLPAWVSYQNQLADSTKNIQFGLLVAGEEYEQLVQTLFDLAEAMPQDSLNRRLIYKHLCAVVRRYLLQKKITIDESVGQLSFAEVLEWLTGYKSVNPLWNGRELGMIKDEKQMPIEEIKQFLRPAIKRRYGCRTTPTTTKYGSSITVNLIIGSRPTTFLDLSIHDQQPVDVQYLIFY